MQQNNILKLLHSRFIYFGFLRNFAVLQRSGKLLLYWSEIHQIIIVIYAFFKHQHWLQFGIWKNLMQNICIKAVNYPSNLLLMMHIFVLAFTTFKDLSKVEFSFVVCFTLNPPQKISETFSVIYLNFSLYGLWIRRYFDLYQKIVSIIRN